MPCDNRCIGDDVFPAPCATCDGRKSPESYQESCFSISGYAGGANKYGLYAYLEMTDAIHEYPPEGAPVKVVETRKVRFVRADLFQAMLNMEYEDRKRLIDELAPDEPEAEEA